MGGTKRREVFDLHIVVCVKQVPAVADVKIDPTTNTLDRSSAPAILNPYDSYALEEAVRLRDRYGGKVTVISMGPPSAVEVIKKCIAQGADEGYLLHDRLFAGSDTLATSYILARGIGTVCREKPYALVICGKQAIDGDTAQVGPGLARRLGIASVTCVTEIACVNTETQEMRVQRKIDEGYSVVAAQLPCLLTMERGFNEPRYASLSGMLRAARYGPRVLGADELATDIDCIGLKGSPTKVVRIFASPQRNQGELLQGEASDMVCQLIDKLTQKLRNGAG